MARIKIGNVRTPVDYLKAFFAPAGYGLGVNTGTLTPITDVHDINKTGWYHFTPGTANSFGGSGVICAVVNEDKYITLTSYAHGMFSFAHMSIAIKVKDYGNWSEWDWVNPPMVEGVEYRTIERWKGKPVYTKLVNLTQLPNNSESSVWLDITGATDVVDYSITTRNVDGNVFCNAAMIPSVTGSWAKLNEYGNIGVYITTDADASHLSAYCTVRYIKN